MIEKPKFIEPEIVRIIHKKPEKFINSMTLKMVHLPKGTCIFGGENSAKEVTIDSEFEIGKYPVTIGEYMVFVDNTDKYHPEWLEEGNEYNIKTGINDDYKEMNLTDQAPIIGVSWHDAVAFCKWLSEKTKQNYRLPTEKEWEYACRAGTETKWSFGDDEKELEKYAWYKANSNGTTHFVGEKEPNPWGLYDMHGNVWECCEDTEDWRHEDEEWKVLRGGSWDLDASGSRSAYRNAFIPTNRSKNVGFRLLRTLV